MEPSEGSSQGPSSSKLDSNNTVTTNQDDDEELTTVVPSLSNDGSKRLLDLLIKRGYLHDNNNNDGVAAPKIVIADPQRGNPQRRQQKQNDDDDDDDDDDNNDAAAAAEYSSSSFLPPPLLLSPDDPSCQVVLLRHNNDTTESTESNSCCCCITYSVLEERLKKELSINNDRINLKRLVQILKLQNDKPIQHLLQQQRKNNENEGKEEEEELVKIFQHGDEIITSKYFDRMVKEVFDSLLLPINPTTTTKTTTKTDESEKNETAIVGRVLVSDLASQKFHLPMDMTLQAIEERLLKQQQKQQQKLQIMKLEQGGPTLVSNSYLKSYQQNVLKTFSGLLEPVTISEICQLHHWDVGLVVSWVKEACCGCCQSQSQKNQTNQEKEKKDDNDNNDDVVLVVSLKGDFHHNVDGGALGSELYTPHAHEQAKRQQVDELFIAQGYMTGSRGSALGLSKSKMGQYIQESFPSAVIISETLVVATEAIISPLEAVIQEAITMNSFVDLNNHIPADILEQEDDARMILNRHVLPALTTTTTTTNIKTTKEEEDQASSTKKKKQKKKKSSSNNNSNNNDPSKSSSAGGVVVLSLGGAVFCSEGLIKNFKQRALPDLIADYAKLRAKELDAAEAAGEVTTTTTTTATSSNKSKKKGKKGKKSKAASSQEAEETKEQSVADQVVPLIEVVKSLKKEYPELMEADMLMKETLEAAADGGGSGLPQLTWEKSTSNNNINIEAGGISDDGLICNEGLICELCRSAFYDDEFVASCRRSIEIELKSLQSARLSKASVSRKDAATKVRNVQSAFEEAFVDCCNVLQAHVKFLDYLKSSNDDDESSNNNSKELVDKLTKELLQGCCADFTSRLTQYCLFKNEIDTSIFNFLPDNKSSSTSSEATEEEMTQASALPIYCVSPDPAIRQYPKTFLSLNSTSDNDSQSKAKDPLPKLREVLPGSIGVTLARQWIMCGGSCYQGGTKVDESGNEFARPGDLEKFVAHVEENCLSLCGLPFKKLDKKSEKQFLFARRQRVLRMLEEVPADDAAIVLDLTILLLFQQVKNVVAFGSSLYPDVLKTLTSERKINEEVADVLTKLSECVESAVDAALVNTVRECGLSKDISKHKIG